MIVKAIATGARLSPFSLLWNPSFWIVIAIWTALVGFYCADYGAEQERFIQQANTIKQMDEQAKSAALVLSKERALRTADRNEFIKYQEDQKNAEENARIVIADLERNNRRLRIPVRIAPAPAADGSRSLANDSVSEGFAEPTIEFSREMVDLLTRGDSAIRKHGEVVDRYERLRIACTAPIEPE